MTMFKKKIMKGFKVCRKENGKFLSATIIAKETEYKKGKWTKRENGCGPFALFDKLIDAIHFARNNCEGFNLKIFNCEYKKSKEVDLYYSTRYGYKSIWYSLDLPYGTVLADEVKITKRVRRRLKSGCSS